ncbi:ABC transporter permease [Ilumatobacter nonamiensis]|uniref:ABC transporter permease n=1 Tax=Ilumatobacter nonamiensis TaxID=467093 RepID=UPI00034710CC|nr:ABC transporter permease subunit [Ilumatobacter nonamiensis]
MNRLPGWLVGLLVAAPIVGLLVFYVWPFGNLIATAVDGESVRTVFGRSRTWSIVWFTTWQAVVSTALTLVVGLAPAWVIARFDFAGRRLLLGLLTAVFVLPTVVMGAAFLALLPESLDRTVWAVIGAHVVFNLAVVVRTVGTVWEHLPPDMEHAAATLGASPPIVFREITLPLIRPAATAAAAIVFLFTFTSFGVIRVLGAAGTRTIEVEVWRRATQLGQVDQAAVLALLQLAILGALAVWSSISARRSSRALQLRPLSGPQHPRTRNQRLLVAGVAGATAVVAITPMIALVVKSISTPSGWNFTAWTDLGSAEVRPGISLGLDPIDALRNSLETAAWTTLFATVIGAVAALGIAAARRGGKLLDAGLLLPIGTSAVTIGFGMLITFDTTPYDWRSTWWIVPVGHALIAVPFVVRATLGVLRAIDPQLSYAALTLGASPARAWREVVLPHLWRPLAVGAALAAAISLGEFGATSFLSRSGGETLPIAIEQLLGRTGSLLQTKGYALATILAAATIGLVMLVDRTGALVGGRSGARSDPENRTSRSERAGR